MTKLEELRSAYEAAAYDVRAVAVAAIDAAYADRDADDIWDAAARKAVAALDAAYAAYYDEIQQEEQND